MVEALESYSTHLAHDKTHSSDALFYRPALVELVDRFKEKVRELDLRYLENPFAAYETVITNVDISLNSVEYTNIVLDENDEIESTNFSTYPSIICVDAHFITAEEYAQRFSIDIETVINWIEDRRIKCAKKEPSGWHIVETQNLPDRNYESGSYIFVGESGDLSLFTSLHKGTHIFTAFQLEGQNDLFEAMSFDANDRLIEHKQISNEELRSLEAILIRSQEVVFENTFVEIVDEKVILGFNANPFLVAEEGILDFITQLDIPQETKSTLKIMAQSNCGESLFITTLEKLSLKEVFLAYARKNIPQTQICADSKTV